MFQVIAEFYNKNAKSLSFSRSHSVLPSEIICPHFSSQCNYREYQRVWRCRKTSVISKTKKRQYWDFFVFDSKGTLGVMVRAVFIIILFCFTVCCFLSLRFVLTLFDRIIKWKSLHSWWGASPLIRKKLISCAGGGVEKGGVTEFFIINFLNVRLNCVFIELHNWDYFHL